MNAGLSTIDLGRLWVDEKGFLGQTIKLGIEYNQLPANADDALRMYLQTHTMMFGQRNRTGIAVGREELEQGLFQATVSLEIGLLDQSEGKANRAVELVATGDFDSIRKRGWELSYFRLKEMQDEASLFPQRRESAFLQEYVEPARKWEHTAPETWVCTDPEEDEPSIANPLESYDLYLDLKLRVALLKSLPPDALKRFGAAVGTKGPFSEILRNLILNVSVGGESLVASAEDIRRFKGMLSGASLSPELLSALVGQFMAQIGEGADTAASDRFLEAVRAEVRDIVALSESGFEGMFISYLD